MKVLLKITMKGIYMVQAEMVMFITSKVKNKFTILWTPERVHQRIVRKKSDLHFLRMKALPHLEAPEFSSEVYNFHQTILSRGNV